MDNISYNEVNAGLGNVAEDTYNYINNILSNPTVILILVVVLIIYIALFIGLGSGLSGGSNSGSPSLLSTQSLSNNSLIASLTGSTSRTLSESSSSSSSSWVFILIALLFVLLIGVNMIQYIYSVDIFAKVKNIFTNHPEVDIVIDNKDQLAPVPEIKLYKEVFNIPNNTYGYEDAKAVCKAYGARLATYDEVEKAYNRGGEWCNYGWSEGQMALFPTQKSTWDKLQTIEGHEHDCGRPGINGGYIANPHVQFGVNCYGNKPRMTSEEEELMATQPIYPKTMKDIAMEKRVEYWKDKLSEIIVSPFNHTSWSKI
jgi:hypothetical protein